MTRVAGTFQTSPETGGPYSPSVSIGDQVAVSGQCGYHPGRRLASGVQEQTRVALGNLGRALQASGCGPDDVLSVNVFLTDRGDFEEMNEIYREYFHTEPRPARTTVYTGLGAGVLVEFSCHAVRTPPAQ